MAIHTAHHVVAPGAKSDCPVLSAAQQLPWTTAEIPASWTRAIVVTTLVAVLALPRPPTLRARLRPGRSPPTRPA